MTFLRRRAPDGVSRPTILSIIAQMGKPAPLFMADGAMLYGAGVSSGRQLMTYAAAAEFGANSPTRYYSGRRSHTGDMPGTNFPDSRHNAMYWYAPLDAAQYAAFDMTGDWLVISSAGATATPGDGYGPYPSNLQQIAPALPAPLHAATPAGGVAFGIDPNSIASGGGQFFGVYYSGAWQLQQIVPAGGDLSAIYTNAGVTVSGMACVVFQKVGNVANVWLAKPGQLIKYAGLTPFTPPALPAVATPWYITDRSEYGGMQGESQGTNRLVCGWCQGTYSALELQRVTDAIFAGIPVAV